VFIRRTTMELAGVLASGDAAGNMQALRARFRALTVFNVLLLLSAVVVMVLKPTF
jgi:hypothetical protein